MPAWTARRWARVALVLSAIVVGVALIAGHIVYWYQPRVRPAAPLAGSVVAGLLDAERYPAVLWLPYPHQNLGMLMGDDAAYADYLAACARLAGLPPLVLPSFGSFPVVPAHEIALASDEQGDHFVVLARVYPAIAAFARLAGRLANNPWLGGGEVMIRDRPAVVSWQDGVWTVRDEDSRPLPNPNPGRTETEGPVPVASSLAVLAMHAAVDPFPAGTYRLARVDGSIEIVSSTTLPPASWQAAGAVPPDNLVLMMMAGARPALAAPARALAFFAHDRGSRDLPRAAAFNQAIAGDLDQWEVPGEDLAKLAGALRQVEHGPWRIAALGGASLTSALAVAPRLSSVAGLDAVAADGLAWALWANLPQTLREVERLAAMLDDLPLIRAKERERWHDATAVLRPVAARFEGLTVAISDQPRALKLRLEAQPPR